MGQSDEALLRQPATKVVAAMTDSPLFAPRPWEAPLSRLDKGAPALDKPLPLADVAAQHWRLLEEDLPLPVAILREKALRANSAWMRGFLERSGASIAPHGKTSMAPALFDLQIRDGAWAITLSTPHQVATALTFGYRRIVMANQLVGRRAIADMVAALRAAPDVEFFCLVDDAANVAALAKAVRDGDLKRPLNVLVELGYPGGRTGCRSVDTGLALARKVASEGDALQLAGIEGFEGLLRNDGSPEIIDQVNAFVADLVRLAEAADAEGLFSRDEILLSAGGSAYYDLVTTGLARAKLSRPKRVLIRSGCYLTHDSQMYVRARAGLRKRDAALAATGELSHALEVWAYVQSRPEAGKAIIGFGKRDSSYDDLPLALHWFRPGLHSAPQPVPDGHAVIWLNDQHCHMAIPETSPLQVGDMLGFGISHPCLTFDKWRVLHLVDESYQITGSIRTYF